MDCLYNSDYTSNIDFIHTFKYVVVIVISSDPPPSPYSLYVGMQEHLYPFLQSTALFFRCLTSINFVHSSGIE